VSEWHDIGSLEELERAGRLVARVGGREVGAVLDRAANRPFGVRNRCPHHGAPLCFGSVRDRVAGPPGRYELEGTRVLRCPWHGWEFDLESGLCRDEPSMRAAVYPARVVGGRVLVEA
jgi:3-phenylpropionate/trans-cinnamate dioxygenase ferredoxin subunit